MRRTVERIVVGRILVDLAGVWLEFWGGVSWEGFEMEGSGSASTGLGGDVSLFLEGQSAAIYG